MSSTPADTSANIALMLEMGAQSFDPMPPGQYLIFLNKNVRITPSAQELLAWVRKWTIRARRGGRSAYVQDGRRFLTLTDAGKELEWKPPFVSKIWSELEQAGLVQKDGKGLKMCGEPTPKRKLNAADSQDDYEGLTEYERRCLDLLPHYAWRKFRSLEPEARLRAAAEYWECDKFCRRVIREAVAGARNWEHEYRKSVLIKYGIELREHPDDDEPAERVVTVQIAPPAPVNFTVQNFETPNPVQAKERLTVTDSYPYERDIEQVRVSKCAEEAGTDSGFTCSDLPTHPGQDEAQTPEAPASEAAEPIEVQNLPVDEGSTRTTAPDDSPIVAFVRKCFGKAQSPAILRQFAAIATENNLTPAAATRFLMWKLEDLIEVRHYPLRSAGAFLDFCQKDIGLWITQNRRELAFTERQEASATPPAVMTPAEELIGLERFLCDFPTHMDADRTRDRIAELRAHLGDQAPAPYDPTPEAEAELARREAQLLTETHPQTRKAIKNQVAALRDQLERELAAALDSLITRPDDDETRAKALRLKALLTTKAKGAAS